MFSRLSISQRITIGLVLVVAFALVLGSNRLDKKHFAEIHHRVNSVHQDRVVVQGYIHRLSNIFHQKELDIIRDKELTTVAAQNREINKLLTDFRNTELTRLEAKRLKELRELNDEYKAIEANLSNDSVKQAAISTLHEIGVELNSLVEIQMDESDKQTILSNDSLRRMNVLFKLEIIFLFLIGAGILLLIFVPVKGEE